MSAPTVVITGASSGIGRAAALEFARRGATLWIAARRAEPLQRVAEECRSLGSSCTPIVTDITDGPACRKLIAAAGVVDVLVNNAGFGTFGLLETAPEDELHRMMETNYFGMVHCTQAVLPQMLERRVGTIVNVASIAGIMGYAGMGGYAATKFAIVGFSEALRDEVISRGVRVALVCPGTTESEFFEQADRTKMPGASRLIPSLDAHAVALAICAAADDGGYRRVLPVTAAIYMKFKEIFPRTAHLLMRRVSALFERRL